MYLGLYDFEGDGVPELIIGDGLAVSVFTVVDGEAVKLADLYNPHSAVWCNNGVWFEEGRMCAEMAGSDGCDYVGFGYVDGQYKLAYHTELTEAAPTINGEPATREEIDRIYPVEYEQRDQSTLCERLKMRQDGDAWVLIMPDGTEARVDEGFDFNLIAW